MPIENSKIVTFYSYKGGVGRTMALANVAYLLAEKYHYKVLVVDWDLDAPGLHRFLNVREDQIKNGLIDLFYDYKALLRKEISSFDEEIINIDNYIIKPSNLFDRYEKGSILFLPAGKFDGEYSRRVNNFNWEDFYKNWHGYGFVEYLKKQLKKKADIILIDSRTGVTDIGGICTLQMPDVVVLLFSLNEQNISGIEMIIKSILEKSTEVKEQKVPPKLILVTARVERYLEQDKRWEWEQKAAKRLGEYFPEKEYFLFSWDSVPGSDSERLLWFLKNNQYINRVENVKIEKVDKTIYVYGKKIPVTIKLNENLEEAFLKTIDSSGNLQVKKENGELNIYKKERGYPLIHIKEKFIPYIGYYSFGEELAVKKDPYGELAKSLDNLTTMVLDAAGFREEEPLIRYESPPTRFETILSNVIKIIENSWIIAFAIFFLFGSLEFIKFISNIVFPEKTRIAQYIGYITQYMGYAILIFLITSIIYAATNIFIHQMKKKFRPKLRV